MIVSREQDVVPCGMGTDVAGLARIDRLVTQRQFLRHAQAEQAAGENGHRLRRIHFGGQFENRKQLR